MQTHSYKVLGKSLYLSGSLLPLLCSGDNDQNISEGHGDKERVPLLSSEIHQVRKGIYPILHLGHVNLVLNMSFPHPPEFSSDPSAYHVMVKSTVPSLETQDNKKPDA